ncbi:MAG: carbohydrate binding domain-containing protein [Bacillota bacterium]
MERKKKKITEELGDLTLNKVVNGTFDSKIANDQESNPDNWYIDSKENGKVKSFRVEEGKFKLDIGDIGNSSSDIQFVQNLNLETDSTYEISFSARADKDRDMNIKVKQPTKDVVYGEETEELSSTMENYSFEIEVPDDVKEAARLKFELGAISEQSKDTAVYFDNVKIEKIAGTNYTESGNYKLNNGDLLLGNPDYTAISYSGFRETSRSDDTVPTVKQIKEDLKLLEAMDIKLLRTYNTEEFSQTKNMLKAIRELKKEDSDFEMYVMLGAWIQCEGAYTDDVNHDAPDKAKNKREIDTAVELADKYPDIIKTIAVGNEAMVEWQAHYVSPDVILKWVNHLKKARKNGDIPKDTLITSSDNFAAWGGEDSYHNDDLKKLVKAVDFVSLHTYPFHDTHYVSDFWKTPAENSDLSDKKKIDNAVKRSVERAKKQYKAVKDYVHSIDPKKPLHIGETGWASKSTDLYGAEESKAADEYKMKKYHDQLREWSNARNISVFYFEGFDEPWKGSDDPGHSEKYFGLFTVDGKAKYLLWDLVDEGTFDGLSRDDNSITKTYDGDKKALMEDVLTPTQDKAHDASPAVEEDTYTILDTKRHSESDSHLAVPVNLNGWEGTCGIDLNDEGVIEISTGTGDWWGCGLEMKDGVNLSNFSDGNLHFNIKGNTKSSFNIGFQTGLHENEERPQTNNSVLFGPEKSYTLTNSWESYSIPVSELMNDADMTDVTSLLYIMGASNFDGRKIYLKDVYYTQD